MRIVSPSTSLLAPYDLPVIIMFRQTKDRSPSGEGESRQPLLRSSLDDLAEERTIFAVDDHDLDDDDELEENTALDNSKGARADHSVRFQEDVHVIGPSLRSTQSSREAGMSCPFLARLF